MEKEFDFDKIGKRMPYQTPEGFFDEMEANIWNEVKDDLLDMEDEAETMNLENVSLSAEETSQAHKIVLKPKRRFDRLRIFVGALSIAASMALSDMRL